MGPIGNLACVGVFCECNKFLKVLQTQVHCLILCDVLFSTVGIADCNCSRNIECSIAGQFSAPDMFRELPSGDSVLYPSSGAGLRAEV